MTGESAFPDRIVSAAADRFEKMAFRLGLAGLLPFLVLGVAMMSVSDPALRGWIGFIQIAYGATILSFLGGIYWGVALGQAPADAKIGVLLISVLPQLFGWVSLLMPPFAAAIGLAAGLALMLAMDRFALRSALVPAWFFKLRATLSIVASAPLLMTLPWR